MKFSFETDIPGLVRLLQQRAGRGEPPSDAMLQAGRQRVHSTTIGVRKYIPVSLQPPCLLRHGVFPLLVSCYSLVFPVSVLTVKGRVSRINLFVRDSPEVREHSLTLAERPEWNPDSTVLLIGFMYQHLTL